MKHYKNDPRKITARFTSSCGTCNKRIAKGTEVYYFPASKMVFCLDCGEASYNAFLASAADEEWYAGQYR
jgi:hypothetical protein